jgi:hypothetical protein
VSRSIFAAGDLVVLSRPLNPNYKGYIPSGQIRVVEKVFPPPPGTRCKMCNDPFGVDILGAVTPVEGRWYCQCQWRFYEPPPAEKLTERHDIPQAVAQ